MAHPLTDARRIVLCLRYGIGDLIMELPALEALRRRAPFAHITGLGAHPATQVLDGDGRVDALVYVQDFGFSHWADRGSPTSRAAFEGWLTAQDFDVVLDPTHAVFGIREILWRRARALLDTGNIIADRALAQGAKGHEAMTQAVREGWGVEMPAGCKPHLPLTSDEQALARHYLTDRGIQDRPLGLSAVTSSPLKRWPVVRFVELAGRLAKDTQRPLLLFCGPQEEMIPEFFTYLPYAVSVMIIRQLHLRQTAALLACCEMLICNDTGLMHVAAAVETPVVALFGPTAASIYLPAQSSAIALANAFNCPYRRHSSFGPPECVTQERCLMADPCIDAIPVDAVYAAVCQQLSNTQPAQRCRLNKR